MKKIVLTLLALSGIALMSSTLYKEHLSFGPYDTIHVGVVPSSLPTIDGNWEKLAFEALNRKTIYNNNYSLYIIYLANKANQQQFTDIFRSESLAKDFYDWLTPSIIAKWNTLPMIEKIYIKDFLTHMKTYLNNFSKENEESYLDGNEKLFYKYSLDNYWDEAKAKPFPIEIADEWRYFEAFVYRRANDGVSVNTMKKYVDLLLSDLIMDTDINYERKADGKLLEKYSIANSKKEGTWTFNQKMKYEGKDVILPKEVRNYKGGKKDGEWKYYTAVGSKAYVSCIKRYKNDEITDLEVYTYVKDKPGQIEQVVKYDVKAREKVTETYENGKVAKTDKEKL